MDGLIVAIYVLGIFSADSKIQGSSWGVLKYAVALSLIAAFLFWVGKTKKPWKNDETWQNRNHLLGVFIAFLIPIATSWVVNGFSTSLNPKDYWQERQQAIIKENCNLERRMVFDSSDHLRVARNKYQQGLLTTNELHSAQESLRFASQFLKDCLEQQNRNVQETERHLQRIGR